MEESSPCGGAEGAEKGKLLEPRSLRALAQTMASQGEYLAPAANRSAADAKETARIKALGVQMAIVLTILPLLLGWGIAELVYQYTGARGSYSGKVDILREHDLAYLYAAALVLSRLTSLLSNLPLMYKTVALPTLPDVRANMYIFRLANRSGDDDGLVLLDNAGEAGRYNRANRSMHHFTESGLSLALSVPLAGFVFPKPLLVVAVLVVAARLAHMLGYVTKGYGGHTPGFVLGSLCTATIDGMLLTVALRVARAY